MGDPVATCFRIAESRVLRCCDIPCLVDAATLCAVAPAAMLVITKSVDTPGARVLSALGIFRQLASIATIKRVVCEVNYGRCDRHERER
jgi:hypothetical protein